MTPAERDAELLDLVFKRGALLELLDQTSADLAAHLNRQAAAVREAIVAPETVDVGTSFDQAMEPERAVGKQLLRNKGNIEINLLVIESAICTIPAGGLDGIKSKFAVFVELTARPHSNERPTNFRMVRQLAEIITREFDEIADVGK